MSRRRAVVFAIDGLRASALGAYGNTAHPTPAMDDFASRSVVVEWMLCTSPELPTFYQAVWGEPPLPRGIAELGGGATLISDDPDVAALGDAAGFGNVVLVESASAASAVSVGDTSLAGLLAVATELLIESVGSDDDVGDKRAARPASLFWIHARGLKGPWDAPLEFRASQLDEGDPAPPTFTVPPAMEIPGDDDTALGFQIAYAAQIAVLDECVQGLLAALEELGMSDDALVALIGSSGFALGEHGVVGSDDCRLFSERLHVPCMLRAPGSAPAPPRWTFLSTPRDLHATLAYWLVGKTGSEAPDGVNLLGDEHQIREHLVARGRNGEMAIRTPNWMMRMTPTAPDGESMAAMHVPSEIELYVKPDDRWEANEVAALCPEDVERLTTELRNSPLDS